METTFLTKSGECELTHEKLILRVDPALPKFKLGQDEFNYKTRIAISSFIALFAIMFLITTRGNIKNTTIFLIMLSVVYGFQFYQLYLYSTVSELNRKDIIRIVYRKSLLSFTGPFFHVFYIDERGKNKNRLIYFRNKDERQKALKIFKDAGVVA